MNRILSVILMGAALMSTDKVNAESAMDGVVTDPTRPGRSMTISQHGIVASAQTLASQAGLDMLRNGGNAMDAAVATAAALAVVEPMMTGLGGDVWILYYEADTGKVHGLNGSGRSPKKLSRAYFDEKEREAIETFSWESVTVPGAVDAYVTAHERFGSMSLAEVLEPAIRYAEEGFPVTEVVAQMWWSQQGNLRRDPWARKTYLIDNNAPSAGTVFKNPNLARTLRLIAEGGRDAFYKGPIAEEIVRYAEESGGFLTMEDFENHHSEWVEPISTNYRGYEVYQCPPNGQGAGVLMMLNILEGYDLSSMTYNSPEYLHLLIEAKKLAYADLYKFVADPSTTDIPVKELLSKDYAKSQRERIDPRQAMEAADPGLPRNGDTTYFTTIDEKGNAVSFINSLFGPFGSGIVGGSTGIVMQNRGEGFSLEKGHVNEYAPGKRPYHTIIPGMVLKNDELYMSYGLMGGAMQPQGHVQMLLSHLDFGYTIQEAVDMPRWRHMEDLVVRLEPGYPQEVLDGLEALGHKVRAGMYLLFGGAQVIRADPSKGVYFGASDPRKDGAALGY